MLPREVGAFHQNFFASEGVFRIKLVEVKLLAGEQKATEKIRVDEG